MIPQIEIPTEGLHAIRALVQLGPDGLVAFRKAFEETGPSLTGDHTRAVVISEAMPNEEAVENIEKILAFAVSSLLSLRQEWSSEELHEMIGDSLVSGNDDSADSWRNLKEQIVALIDSPVGAVEAKSRELSRQRPNRITKLWVFSDVRPVFDEERTEVKASLLIDTLRLRFHDGVESRVLDFSLEPKQLEELIQQATAAQKKNGQLRRQNDKLNVPTLNEPDPEANN